MANIVKDRVLEFTNVTGFDPIQLNGSPIGYRRFGDVLSDGDECYYTLVSESGDWETGISVYDANLNTLDRGTVTDNSVGSNTQIPFQADSKKVFLTFTAQAYKDLIGTLGETASWGLVTGDIDNQTDLVNKLNSKAPNMFTLLGTGAVPRTLASKLGDTVSVEDFGAVGDGVTDDYAAIQAALNYIRDQANGGRLEFSSKIYLVEAQLRIYSNTYIDLGGGTVRSGFNTSPSGSSLFALYHSDNRHFENITLCNGTLDGNGANFPNTGNLFGVAASNGITRLRIDNVIFLDVQNVHAIDLNDARDVHISRCHFLGFKDNGALGDRRWSDAIQLSNGVGCHDITIENCIFGANPATGHGPWGVGVGNHGSGIGAPPVTNVTVRNCSFYGMGYAGVRTFGDWRNIAVQGCLFENCDIGVYLSERIEGSDFLLAADVKIVGNTFVGGGTYPQIRTSTSTGRITAYPTYKKLRHISIEGNVFTDLAGGSINVGWIDGLVIRGNSFSNCAGIRVRFCSNSSIGANNADNISGNFCRIVESSETVFARAGLTSAIVVDGNTISNVRYRLVHVNCAARGVTISGNIGTNVGHDGTTARPMISADSGAQDITSVNNTLKQTADALGSASFIVEYNSGTTGMVVDNRGVAAEQVRMGGTGHLRHSYSGTPLGVITAPIGSVFTRTDGGAATCLYVKESGNNANTGWVAK